MRPKRFNLQGVPLNNSITKLEDYRPPASPLPVEDGAVRAKGTNLWAKMAAITADVGRVPKNGYNDHYKYHFAKESDVVDAVKKACYDHNVSIRFGAIRETIEHIAVKTSKGNPATEVRLWVRMTVTNCDDPSEKFVEEFPGEAQDSGDKGIWKAVTGARKYALISTFLVSTGDDPENSGAGDGAAEQPRDAKQQRKATTKPPAIAPQEDSMAKQLHDGRVAIQKLIVDRKIGPDDVAAIWVDVAGNMANHDWKIVPIDLMRAFYAALSRRFPALKVVPSPEAIRSDQTAEIEKLWAHLPQQARYALVSKHTYGRARDLDKATAAEAELIWLELKTFDSYEEMATVVDTFSPPKAEKLDSPKPPARAAAPIEATAAPIDDEVLQSLRGNVSMLDMHELAYVAAQCGMGEHGLRAAIRMVTKRDMLTSGTFRSVLDFMEQRAREALEA